MKVDHLILKIALDQFCYTSWYIGMINMDHASLTLDYLINSHVTSMIGRLSWILIIVK